MSVSKRNLDAAIKDTATIYKTELGYQQINFAIAVDLDYGKPVCALVEQISNLKRRVPVRNRIARSGIVDIAEQYQFVCSIGIEILDKLLSSFSIAGYVGCDNILHISLFLIIFYIHSLAH